MKSAQTEIILSHTGLSNKSVINIEKATKPSKDLELWAKIRLIDQIVYDIIYTAR